MEKSGRRPAAGEASVLRPACNPVPVKSSVRDKGLALAGAGAAPAAAPAAAAVHPTQGDPGGNSRASARPQGNGGGARERAKEPAASRELEATTSGRDRAKPKTSEVEKAAAASTRGLLGASSREERAVIGKRALGLLGSSSTVRYTGFHCWEFSVWRGHSRGRTSGGHQKNRGRERERRKRREV